MLVLVLVLVLAECTHARAPSTRSPVSSTCTTGAAASWPRTAVVNAPSPAAACSTMAATVPTDTGAPSRSARVSAVRANGRCCAAAR